jgi:phosphoserine phosphatase
MRKPGSVAAFFDLDGTLVPFPSLEWRLFRSLRAQGLIAARTYLIWFWETMGVLMTGVGAARHESKAYLRNLCARDVALYCEQEVRSTGQPFFDAAIDRILWHAAQGHALVIISGTLSSLARSAICALEAATDSRGATIRFIARATQLEQLNGCCTGSVAGRAMFGPAKAKAMLDLALQNHWDLTQCFAYGDSYADRFMLEGVGRPTAVNPSPALRRLARKRAWPVVHWTETRVPTPQVKVTESAVT